MMKMEMSMLGLNFFRQKMWDVIEEGGNNDKKEGEKTIKYHIESNFSLCEANEQL